MPHPGDNSWRTLYPFESHWQRIAGQQLHYVVDGPRQEVGEADTLLFVHGNPTWSFHWRNLILALRDRFRCVAVDHLGCGLSDRGERPLRLADRIAHLVEFIDRLQLQRITLVAQDWGGAIGLGCIIERPELFQRIALYNTGAFPPRTIPRRIRACQLPVVGRLAVQGAGLFSRAALRMALARRTKLDPAVRAGYLAPYADWSSRQAIYDFVQDIPAAPRHPTWQTLEQIEAGLPALAHLPILLCWGMRDWCFTPECLQRFAAIWPHAYRCTIPDAGHWVVEDAPEEAKQWLTGLMEGFPADLWPQLNAHMPTEDAASISR